jgi:hypothetical protein
MMDYIDTDKAVFSSVSPFMKMGISLFENQSQSGGSSSLSTLYFPGGLFVKNKDKDVSKIEEILECETDPFKIDVVENFDVFIDLVNVSVKKSNKTKKSKKTSVKN